MDNNIDRNTGAVELRELSAIENYALLTSVVESAHTAGVSCILPFGVVNNEMTDTLHTRYNKVQSVETFHPDFIEVKIREGLRKRRGFDPYEKNTLDEIVNKVGPAIVGSGFLTEAGLLKTEQLLFLRGVILATKSRYYEAEQNPEKTYSEKQRKLQAAALWHLNHLATNFVAVPPNFDVSRLDDFSVAYSTAYLARIVKDEAEAQNKTSQNSTSIKMCMLQPIPFGKLKSGESSEVISVFPNGDTGEKEGFDKVFKKQMPSQILEERIVNLRRIQDTFGDNETVFTFYEGMRPFRAGGKSKSSRGDGTSQPDRQEPEQAEDKYFILEIKPVDQNGNTKTHVVADNPKINNSAYALREEVLDEWEKLTGIKLIWKDIFSQSRQTARNFGAREFRHNPGSDVPKRINNYLNQETQSLVLETFGRIFDRRERQYFDDDMNPTYRNTMPALFVEAVRNSAPLRALWPLIREHGYEQTQRILLGSERARKETAARIDTEQKRLDVRQFAADLFARMVQSEIDLR